MAEAVEDFVDVAPEGPYGFKNSREDVMRPQFPGFDKLSQSDARMVVEIQMGLRKQHLVHIAGQAILVNHHPARWIDDATGQGWGYVIRRIKSELIPVEPIQRPVLLAPVRVDWEIERSSFLEERSRVDQELARARDEKAELAEKNLRLETELREERDRNRKSQKDIGVTNDLERKTGELESACKALSTQLADEKHRSAEQRRRWEVIRQELEQNLARQKSESDQHQLDFKHQSDRRERLGLEQQALTAAKLREWQSRCLALEQDLVAERDKSHFYVPASQTLTNGSSAAAGSRGTLFRVIVIWAVVGILLLQILLPSIHLH